MSLASSRNEYVEGTCYYCGNSIWSGEDYLYVNPYTLETYLNQPTWEYTEITHADCVPEEDDKNA